MGAAGAALGHMVGDLTTGKKKYAAVEADIQALNARAEALRLRLEQLVQAYKEENENLKDVIREFKAIVERNFGEKLS